MVTRATEVTKTKAPAVNETYRQPGLFDQLQVCPAVQFHRSWAIRELSNALTGDCQQCFLTQETPGNEACQSLSEPPPKSQGRHRPLLVAGQKLEKDGGVEDQVAAGAECREGDEEAPGCDVGTGARHDCREGGDQQGDVECDPPPDDVGTETPKDGPDQQSDVERDGSGIAICRRRRQLQERPGVGDGLHERDEGVDGVAEAVEDEELPVKRSPTDLIVSLWSRSAQFFFEPIEHTWPPSRGGGEGPKTPNGFLFFILGHVMCVCVFIRH